MIVTTAIDQQKNNVVVVSEDTDVLVLLTALTNSEREIYYLKPSKGKIEQKVYSSRSFKLIHCKEHILFVHVLTGCDTTSGFFKKGKNAFAKLFEKRLDLHPCAESFKCENQDLQKLYDEGIKCILALYGGPQGVSLDEFR